MSTLVAQTISNGTVSTSTANVINGAKAWVNFNGTGTVAIRASYNVSSITDNGTGDYTVNFTNAFADANYAVVSTIANTENNFSSAAASSARGAVGSHIHGTVPPTTTSYRLQCLIGSTDVSNGAFLDSSLVSVSIFR
jgi:hypothetical protein